jgi:hypothetical protein
VADVHSEILDPFEVGWNALGTERQQKWLGSAESFGKLWTSWAEVLVGQLEAENRERQGAYYNPSPMETIRNKIADFTCRKLPQSGSLLGITNLPGTPDVRDRVCKMAASILLRDAAAGIMQWLNKEIEKDGVDVMRKIVFGNKQ